MTAITNRGDNNNNSKQQQQQNNIERVLFDHIEEHLTGWKGEKTNEKRWFAVLQYEKSQAKKIVGMKILDIYVSLWLHPWPYRKNHESSGSVLYF